ncbi:S8 family serine peptidase [Thalassolituus marinus]|uniref:S8 family serine peptidase n=1 Tax=Thalassolituus marinus TaxID=671053 RepID=A0ABS7ZNY7_9GAMM|nr:S8 family serine peptidase [Thalassolituus marinus]MCA6063403.1 S8 family serine peptidase [Thalassolituus marinus]
MQDQTGSGVKVAVIDSGLEIAHEDLKANVLSGRSYDFINSDNDPTSWSRDGDHGTSVAGLIAATGFNDLGGRGVAPDASLMGLNWLQSQSFLHWQQSLGGTRTDDARVINLSYGLDVSGPMTFFDSWNNAAESHLAQVQASNNSGKGIVLMKSAGNSFEEVGTSMTINGRNIYAIGNYHYVHRWSGHIAGTEPESSSIYYTVISALNAYGSRSSYSSTGASVWVSAPGGEYGTSSPAMITTDQSGCSSGYAKSSESGFDGGSEENESCNYTSSFNGTSSAAPVASGVAALIIAANPDLHWRDVRHILAATAVKIDKSFLPVSFSDNGQSFYAEPGWITNNAGYHFHNWYGFGMVDATAAVTMATDAGYESLGPLQSTGFVSATTVSPVTIPESADGVTRTVAISDNYSVEGVQVRFSASHSRDADISVEITSPAGTRSLVLPPRSLLVLDQDDYQDADFADTVLLSNAFYGESSQGNWTITVRDTNSGDFNFFGYDANTDQTVLITTSNPASGTLGSVSLRIYGH